MYDDWSGLGLGVEYLIYSDYLCGASVVVVGDGYGGWTIGYD